LTDVNGGGGVGTRVDVKINGRRAVGIKNCNGARGGWALRKLDWILSRFPYPYQVVEVALRGRATGRRSSVNNKFEKLSGKDHFLSGWVCGTIRRTLIFATTEEAA